MSCYLHATQRGHLQDWVPNMNTFHCIRFQRSCVYNVSRTDGRTDGDHYYVPSSWSGGDNKVKYVKYQSIQKIKSKRSNKNKISYMFSSFLVLWSHFLVQTIIEIYHFNSFHFPSLLRLHYFPHHHSALPFPSLHFYLFHLVLYFSLPHTYLFLLYMPSLLALIYL